GTPIIGYGRHGDPLAQHGGSLVVECGHHFSRAAAELATDVTLRFLTHLGMIAADPAMAKPPVPQRYRLLETHVVKSEDFHFTRPVVGFETFDKDELIAMNGTEEIRSPCDQCTIFMPTRVPIVGRE